MSNNQYELIWKVLRENDFNFDEVDCMDLICVLCKKLIVEAKQAPCACKFCATCIEEYLSNGNLMCPGNTDECYEEVLQLGENVTNHSVTNRLVSKLKLKCPSRKCSYKDILSNMEHHLILCGKQSIVCPYSEMGCNKIGPDKKEIVNHLQLESFEHAKLIIEMIDKMRNEIGIMVKENTLLKVHSDRQQKLIEDLQSQIEEIKRSSSVEELNPRSYSENSDTDLNSSPLDFELESDRQSQISEALIENHLSDNDTSYTWTIRKFSNVKNFKSIDNNGFYTRPTRCFIKLRLVPHIEKKRMKSSISIYPNCYPGNYDDSIQWPVRCQITIGIVNKALNCFLLHDTKTIYYVNSDKSPVPAFDFPLNERSCLKNDCLLIRSIIKIIE